MADFANLFYFTLQPVAFFILSGLSLFLGVGLVFHVASSTGIASLTTPHNVLLLAIILAEAGFQMTSGFEVYDAWAERALVGKYICTAMFQTLLMYQWTRTFSILQSELSGATIKGLRVVLLLTTALFWFQPLSLMTTVFTQLVVASLCGVMVLILTVIMGYVCSNIAEMRTESIESGRAAYSRIVATHTVRTSVFVLLSVVAYSGQIIAGYVHDAALEDAVVAYATCGVLLNLFVFCIVATLVSLKFRLDEFAAATSKQLNVASSDKTMCDGGDADKMPNPDNVLKTVVTIDQNQENPPVKSKPTSTRRDLDARNNQNHTPRPLTYHDTGDSSTPAFIELSAAFKHLSPKKTCSPETVTELEMESATKTTIQTHYKGIEGNRQQTSSSVDTLHKTKHGRGVGVPKPRNSSLAKGKPHDIRNAEVKNSDSVKSLLQVPKASVSAGRGGGERSRSVSTPKKTSPLAQATMARATSLDQI